MSIAVGAPGLLHAFTVAGVLTWADVHVARRIGVLGGETDEAVLLAVALTVRSTRQGSVLLDLATAHETVTVGEEDAGEDVVAAAPLPWPDRWVERCTASPLLDGPVRLAGSRLWLRRYWDQEEQVARELRERCSTPAGDMDLARLAAALDRLFGHVDDADQREAAAVCALTRVSVLAGGPGTGKTTTVARLIALLREQHPAWRMALAAPTGKAAARLEEAVRTATAGLPEADRERLGDLSATTLHRLLGWRPDARGRFRHDRSNRLPVEVLIVDESSMLSLTLIARLLEALRPSTRLVLVGDPDQLASVEAGAVLADLVDRSHQGARTPELAAALRPLLPGTRVLERAASPAAAVRDGVAVLSTTRRFAAGGGIAVLAAAVRAGDADVALTVLRSGADDVEFVEVADDVRPGDGFLTRVRADVQAAGDALHAAAAAGDAVAALEALERHRLLCAHHHGSRGVQFWSDVAAAWVRERHPIVPRADGHYVGEPLLVTANDYEAGVYNGDTGVALDDGAGGIVVAFSRGGEPILVPLTRLGAVQSLHAMTIHRSQGSQFDQVTVLLPPATSPLATRQTLYTALTRPRRHVRVIGSAEALAAAAGRPAARASGLRERLEALR
jgi:exodeoxyribonuclease V alpha subunit